jgi:lipid II:glycine glycyltransferase (peptidoglycan interpeptide bridge formation enzyme)/ribosomal protein S18 acetylase RimI-like enzyme
VREATADELAALRAEDRTLPLEFYLDRLRPGVRPFVAWWDGQPAHISWVYPPGERTSDMRLRKDEAEIRSSVTLPAFRGRGLYQAVIAAIARELRASGVERLYAHVLEENAASLRAFLASGFEVSGRLRAGRAAGIPFAFEEAAPPRPAPGPSALEVRYVTEAAEWDARITRFSDHDLYQGFAWGEVLRGHGWTPWRLAVLDGETCVAAISILTRRFAPVGPSLMYAPRGPLVDARDPRASAAIAALARELRSLGRRERSAFLRVSPGWDHADQERPGLLTGHGFRRLPDDYTTWNTPRIVMHLPLHGGEQGVRSRMRKSTRQKLGVADRHGVVIRDGRTEDDFRDLHRFVALNAKRKAVPVRPLEYFRKLHTFAQSGAGKLSFAEWEGRRVAAQFGVRYGRKAHFLYYGVHPDFLHLGTARAMDWEHIKWALAEGCDEIDLGGSATAFPPRETDRGYGVYQYKAGLGCELRYLTGYYDLVFQPALYRAFRVVEERVLPSVWWLRSRLTFPERERTEPAPAPAPPPAAAPAAPRLAAREITDRETWNALVVALPHYDLRQGYEWGEVRSTQRWTPRRIAIFRDGACVAAASVLIKAVPRLGRTVMYVSGGPLFADLADLEARRALMDALARVAAEVRAVFLRLSPKVPDTDTAVRAALLDHGFTHLPDDWTTWNSPRVCMAMDIRDPEETLARKLRKRYREYIASAPRRGLSVRQAASLDEGWAFHAALAAVGRQKGLPVRGRPYFERIWREYIRPGRGVLLLAEHEGRPAGGLLGVRIGQRAYMLYVTLPEEVGAVKLHQGPLLYWQFIRWARNAGCTDIDWGGIGTNFPPREDDPGFGLYHFKLGFHSSLEYLTGYYDHVYSPALYSLFRFTERRLFSSAWKTRARLNLWFYRRRLMGEARRRVRRARIRLSQQGPLDALAALAGAVVGPQRLTVMGRALQDPPPGRPARVACEAWDAGTLRAWRASRRGLPPEFFQDEIDGAEVCLVALDERRNPAGVMWVYRPEDASGLVSLQEGEAEIGTATVLPSHRGRGVFGALLAFACRWLADQGCRTAYAALPHRGDACERAYARGGFRALARMRHFPAGRLVLSADVRAALHPPAVAEAAHE